MYAIKSAACASVMLFGLMTLSIKPAWKPSTVFALGCCMDSLRYRSPAVTMVPSESRTREPASPFQVGPTDGEPSVEWQLRHPLSSASARPLAAGPESSCRPPHPARSARPIAKQYGLGKRTVKLRPELR